MKTDIPDGLIDWLSHIGAQAYLNQPDIQNGRLVGNIMQNTVEGYKLQLLSSASAVNRVSNWNNLMTQLKKIGIKVSQQDKTKIINGNHDIVFQIVSKLRDHTQKNKKQTQVDISKISVRSEVSESNSLLELFILAIMKNFSLSSKESVALLSNESKYLAHILAKGLKGDFKPIQGFLLQLQRNMSTINDFCKNKQNQIFFVRSVKPALISKSEAVSESSLSLFNNFLNPIDHKFQIIKDHLLNTLLLGIKRHSFLSTSILTFILQTSQYNRSLLSVIKAHTAQAQFQNIFLQLWEICKNKNRLKQFFQFLGINEIISGAISNVRSSDTVLSSLNLLITLCDINPQIMQNSDDSYSFIQNLQKVQLSKHAELIVFNHQLFTLLYIFGRDKNAIAPSLYKILATKYQETINENESRAFIMNFLQIVTQFPSIPFSFIVEVINSRVEGNTLKICELQLNFFEYIIESESLDLKTALIVYNIVSKVIVDETAFAETSSNIILTLLKKYSTENIFMDMTVKLIKVCLAVHFANARKIVMKRKSLSSSKAETDDSILKSKNLSLENFLYKVSELEFADINTQVQPLLCYSIIQIERISKDLTKPLRKILELFGDVTKILKKYEEEVHKMDEQTKKEDGKKSKVKDSGNWGVSVPSSRYQSPDNKLNRASSGTNPGDETRKKSYSKNQSLYTSQLGVTPAAQKGLDKYQKVYLHKVQRIESQKNKELQAAERQLYLKKVFERKMLEKGVEVKKINSEDFQYIYEFDQKEKQIHEDTVRGKIEFTYYESTNQEERDIKALDFLMKKYQRVFKVLYGNYSGHHKPKKLDNFTEIAQQYHLLTSAGSWKLLKDHNLDEYITVKEVQYLIKRLNIRLKKEFQDMTCLDYEGFEQFILQCSFAMFTRPPKDYRGRPMAEMVQQTMSQFKTYSTMNRINEQLFQDPDNIYFNETQAIKELNNKLAENADYILPQGYKKIVEKKVIFSHKIFLDAMSETYKDVYQVLNQIIFKAFDVNLIQPFSLSQTVAKVRPTLYYTQRLQGQVNSQKMSIFMKKEAAKFPIKDREVAKQAAGILDDIIDAVQLGHDEIGKKHENKLIKQRKERQEHFRKLQEEGAKKRGQRDKYIKSALTKHKQALTEKKKEQKVKRKEDRKKQEEQKKKRKQEEEALKKRVEEYQKVKKQQERERRKKSIERKRKQQQDIERRVKQLQENKSKKQQERKQKEAEEEKRRREQARQERKRRQEEKKKFDEEQKRKKQMIEEYKNKKSGLKSSKVRDDQDGEGDENAQG